MIISSLDFEMTSLGLAWVAGLYIEGSGAGADYFEAGMKAGQHRLGLWGQSLPFPSGMEEERRAEQQHDTH